MKITELPTSYRIQFPFNKKIQAVVKEIKGARYNGLEKCWYAPLEAATEVSELKAKYELNAKYHAPERYGSIPELPYLNQALQLKRKPYPYQERGIAAGLQFRRFINGDDMGTGKSIQTIATLVAANAFPALIVCPDTIKENWLREFNLTTNLRVAILKDSVKKTWPLFLASGLIDVYIVNYESLPKYFTLEIQKKKRMTLADFTFRKEISDFKAVAYDESHKLKNSATIQSKICKAIAVGKEYVIMLTGTPVMNEAKDLISQLDIMGRLQDFGGYNFFYKRYCGGNGKESTNLKELNYRLATTCYFRRMKKEVLPDLPDKTRTKFICDITTRKEYDDAMQDFKKYLKEYTEKTDEEIRRSMRAQILVRMTKCRNIAARGKLVHAAEYVDEIIDAGQKVAVFVHQREVGQFLLDRYPSAVCIRGGDNSQQRQAAIDAFQRCKKCGVNHEHHNSIDHEHVPSDVPLIVVSIEAGGVGVTLTACSRGCFIEYPWNSAKKDQVEDRLWRNGQKNAVEILDYVGANTIDEYMYEIIESKRNVANEVTGTPDDIQRILINKLIEKLGL